MTPHLVGIRPSSLKTKKWTAIFDDGTRVHFGGAGCGDYPLYYEHDRSMARRKRRAYIARHRVSETWLDPTAPGTLARIILWEYPTVHRAVKKYDDTVRMWRLKPHLRYSKITQ